MNDKRVREEGWKRRSPMYLHISGITPMKGEREEEKVPAEENEEPSVSWDFKKGHISC